MALVSPFRALHYNTEMYKDASDVVIPPYDNIPAGDEKKYLSRSPYNFAHVLLPQGPHDDYSRSAALLAKWREQDILKETTFPAYFLYQQKFTAYGKSHQRHTLMCTVGLRDFADAIVRPHENTFGQFKADRLQILRKTQCNLSHVFAMVKDPDGFLESVYEKWQFEKPFLTGKTDEGVSHALWKIDGAKAPQISQFFVDRPLYIVDGHHRYESSLMYAKELGVQGKFEHPASHMLFAIANSYDPGLIVFPTHRVVRKGALTAPLTKHEMEKHFQLLPLSPEALKGFVEKVQPTPQFAVYYKEDLFLVMPKHWQHEAEHLGKSVAKLSVTWSDHKFLKDLCQIDETNRSQKIAYEKDATALWNKREDADLIIFHAPPAISDITNVADEKGFMPQKSTYFYPKLAAGFTMRHL